PVTCSAKYVESFVPKHTVKHRDGETLTVLDCADLIFEAPAKDRGAGPERGWAQPYRRQYARRGYAVVSPRGYLTFATGGPGAGGREEEEEGDDDDDGGPAGMRLPGFFTGEPLTEGQQELSRQVLSVRSHVDKALTYRFLRGAHSRTMERQVDRAWVICCYLACINHRPMGLE
ncbi:hypothetical protein chiPu_0030011, partial [Chiloscyllium punctatum]|nr:hypothetical protein [Chiloscyllium punctatum]